VDVPSPPSARQEARRRRDARRGCGGWYRSSGTVVRHLVCHLEWGRLRAARKRGNCKDALLRHHASLGRIGETIEATLWAPSVAGFPDRRTDVPVRVRLASEQVLSVDDDPRGIIWSEGGSGTTTFLVDASTKSIRNRERRAALARPSGLLQQLTSSLKPLAP